MRVQISRKKTTGYFDDDATMIGFVEINQVEVLSF